MAPKVDLVIPVLNEAHVLERSVDTVRAFLGVRDDYEWRIVIAENGSVDGTGEIAARLAREHDDVDYLALKRPGRGDALRQAWTASDADVVCYTDVDLSTELEALPLLAEAILEQGYDVAVGSRLARESDVTRSRPREVISRAYNLLLRLALGVSFSDAQCGFKAVSRDVVESIVPRIEDESWFFDTELLVLAQADGRRIKDIPVRWVEDDDSRVKIVSTAWEDIKGVARLRRQLGSLRTRG